MRNPFRRRRRLPGAQARWDEDAHVRLSDDYVAVPEDQLPAETTERLDGVALYSVEDRFFVIVDLGAAKAQVAEWTGQITPDGELPPDDQLVADGEVMLAALNDPANWAKIDSDSEAEGDFAFFEIDLLTARIQKPQGSLTDGSP